MSATPQAPLPLLLADSTLLTGQRAALAVAASFTTGNVTGTPSTPGAAPRAFVTRLTNTANASDVTTVTIVDSGSGGLFDGSYTTPSGGVYALAISLATPGGLSAAYYNNRWFMGEPVLQRSSEAPLNFSWGAGLLTPTGLD